MNTWRPAPRIRVKALGLHWRGDRLLAAEVLDDAGHVKGVRPLGGTVEFGETAEMAVIREFQEELGIVVKTNGVPFLSRISLPTRAASDTRYWQSLTLAFRRVPTLTKHASNSKKTVV
jgi:hypothetical protein